jgi:hypothetical protein
MKDFLEERGVQNIYGSKDATREAYKAGLIENGEVLDGDDPKPQSDFTHLQRRNCSDSLFCGC